MENKQFNRPDKEDILMEMYYNAIFQCKISNSCCLLAGDNIFL